MGDDLRAVLEEHRHRVSPVLLFAGALIANGLTLLILFASLGCSRQEASSVDAEAAQLRSAPLVELAPGLYWDEAAGVNLILADGLLVAAEPSDGRPLKQRVVGAWRKAKGDTSESPFGGENTTATTTPEDDEDSDDEGLEPTGTASYEPSRGLSTRVAIRWPFEDELSEEDLEILEQIHPGCI